MIKEAIPGNIRKAEHFVAFLKRFVEYMKVGYAQERLTVRHECEFSMWLPRRVHHSFST
jgi:hypothetical protein